MKTFCNAISPTVLVGRTYVEQTQNQDLLFQEVTVNQKKGEGNNNKTIFLASVNADNVKDMSISEHVILPRCRQERSQFYLSYEDYIQTTSVRYQN